MTSKIRVILADDHDIVRLGLITLINDQPNMFVVGEAGTASEAISAVEQLHPDVVLMDIRMPGEGAIEASQQIMERFPETHVVILTSFGEDELLVRAIRAGVSGYVLKQSKNDELLRAITAASEGQVVLDPATTAQLMQRVRQVEQKIEADVFRDLSENEIRIIAEVAHGKTNAEIGKLINLSEKTVRNYVSSLLDKFQFNNRIELAIFAVEHHINDYLRKG